jgi:hypothetical protein
MHVNRTRALAVRADSEVDPARLMKMVANRRNALRDAIVFIKKLPANADESRYDRNRGISFGRIKNDC